jgi:molybdopterin converting factor small subunit
MKIDVSYMSQLRRSAGLARETLDVAGPTTVQEFLSDVICRRHPNLGKAILGANGVLHPILMIFVGDRQIDAATPAPLADGNEVTLMFPISGG